MVKHVHFQVGFVDKTFVTQVTLDLSLGHVIANGMKLQGTLSLEELVTNRTRVIPLR